MSCSPFDDRSIIRNGVKLCEKPDCQNKSLAARFCGGWRTGGFNAICRPNGRVGTRDPFIEGQPVGNLQFPSAQRPSPTTPRHFLASIVRERVRRMHEEENSSTRCLIKHQNEFRRNRREAVFLFAALPMSAYGTERTCSSLRGTSAFGVTADIAWTCADVR